MLVNKERGVFTQTHLLVGAAVFSRPGARAVALAGLLGAVLPDADVWSMFVIERLGGASSCEIFHYRYWEQPWTTVQMVVNSIPLWLVLLGVGLALGRLAGVRHRVTGVWLWVFAASALLHVIADFLLHHEDARAQWMPFSNRVFRSPVSYWDPDHFGQVFMPFEIVLGLGLAAITGARFRRSWVWAGLGLLLMGYVGTIAAGQVSVGQHPRGPGSCELIAAQKAAAHAVADPATIAN